MNTVNNYICCFYVEIINANLCSHKNFNNIDAKILKLMCSIRNANFSEMITNSNINYNTEVLIFDTLRNSDTINFDLICKLFPSLVIIINYHVENENFVQINNSHHIYCKKDSIENLDFTGIIHKDEVVIYELEKLFANNKLIKNANKFE
jgi:hypothetical protein